MISGTKLQLDWSVIGSEGPNRIIVGVTHLGERAIMDRTWRSHTYIAGEPGGGKGVLARTVQAHELFWGVVTAVLQPKPGENGWMEGAAVIATTPDEYVEVLAKGCYERQLRQRVMENYRCPVTGMLGLQSIREHPDYPEKYPEIRIWCDELAGLIGQQALLTMPRETIVAITTMIADLAARGRSAGIALGLMTQRPHIGANFVAHEQGGAVLASITQRFNMDRNLSNVLAMFEHASPIEQKPKAYIEQNRPGRGAYAFCDPKDQGHVMGGQMLLMEPEQARQFALRGIRRFGVPELLVPEGIPDDEELAEMARDELDVPKPAPDKAFTFAMKVLRG